MTDAILNFTDDTYVERLWFASWAGTDWMCAVYRDGPDAPWRATWRFRYDDDPDEKRVFAMHTDAADTSRDKLVDAFEQFAATLDRVGATRFSVPIQGSGDLVSSALAAQDWLTARLIAPVAPVLQ